MYVLEGTGSDPWDATYEMKAQLNTYDQFAIDGTYFQHKTGLYHIYSCWYREYDAWPANLCITKSKSGILHFKAHANPPSVRPVDCQLQFLRASDSKRAIESVGKDAIRPTLERPFIVERRSSAAYQSAHWPRVCHLLCCPFRQSQLLSRAIGARWRRSHECHGLAQEQRRLRVLPECPGAGLWRWSRIFYEVPRWQGRLDRVSWHEGSYQWMGCSDNSYPKVHLESRWYSEIPSTGIRTIPRAFRPVVIRQSVGYRCTYQ